MCMGLSQQQHRVIDFLIEENRTLREVLVLGRKRPTLNDQQRRTGITDYGIDFRRESQ